MHHHYHCNIYSSQVTTHHQALRFFFGLAASERQDVSEDVSNLATLDVFEEDSNTGDTVGRDAWRIWEVLVFQGCGDGFGVMFLWL